MENGSTISILACQTASLRTGSRLSSPFDLGLLLVCFHRAYNLARAALNPTKGKLESVVRSVLVILVPFIRLALLWDPLLAYEISFLICRQTRGSQNLIYERPYGVPMPNLMSLDT